MQPTDPPHDSTDGLITVRLQPVKPLVPRGNALAPAARAVAVLHPFSVPDLLLKADFYREQTVVSALQ